MSEAMVTDTICKERCGEILSAIKELDNRLYRDNGTISIQTRIDRHDQTLHALTRLVYGGVSLALVAIAGQIIKLVIK